MTAHDDIINETRSAGQAYLARFEYDLARVFEDLKAREKANNRKIADLKPVQPRPRHPASR